MAQPFLMLDGAQKYASRTITINSVAYKVNNLTVTPAWTEAEDYSTDGRPGRKRWTRQRITLSGELQIATSSTALPPMGTTFSDTFDSNVGSTLFVVTVPVWAESNAPGAIQVVPFSAEEVINGSVTLVTS